MWETYFRQYKDTVLPFWLDKQKWNYKDDIIMVGYDDLAAATGDNTWRDAIFSSSRFLMLPDGTVVNLCPESRNIDKISFGKTLTILRNITGDPRYVKAVEKVFDLRPHAIIERLQLRKPIYRRLAAYGHMGREDLGVLWEKTDMADELKKIVSTM